MPPQLFIGGLIAIGLVSGYVIVRGFTAELASYEPSIGEVQSQFRGTIMDVHDQLIGSIDRVCGVSVIGDEGHTVMIDTVPAIRIEGAFGLFVRAELQQVEANRTLVFWTAMAKTPWASHQDLKHRSLVQLERDIRNSMKSCCGAQEVLT